MRVSQSFLVVEGFSVVIVTHDGHWECDRTSIPNPNSTYYVYVVKRANLVSWSYTYPESGPVWSAVAPP